MKSYIAKKLIKKYQPTVIFVCGSWGKTMSASAILDLLKKSQWDVRFLENQSDHYEALASGGQKYSLVSGLSYLAGLKSYPDAVIIEVGREEVIPASLIELIENKVLVIPYITQNDIESSGGVKKYLNKKCSLNKKNAKEFNVVYCQDNLDFKTEIPDYELKRTESFGITSGDAGLTASSIQYKLPEDAHLSNDKRVQGLTMKMKNGGSTLPIKLDGGIGNQHIYALLAAIGVSRVLGINMIDGIGNLNNFFVIPGRMSLIPGIKKTMLVDDSYDIDLESALMTFEAGAGLPIIEKSKRIAIVGDILHEGVGTETAHSMLGKELSNMNYDMIVAIGEKSHNLVVGAKEAGFDESKIFHFMDKDEADLFVQHELKPGDLVIIKGPKEEKFETIVKELMAFPLRAKDDLLQR